MKRLSMLTVLASAALAAGTAMAENPPGGMNMPGMQMSGSVSARKEKLGRMR